MPIYDVNAGIDKPDLLGSFRQGEQYGATRRQQIQQQQDNAALRGLAPQVLAGDAGAYEQAAAIDPEAATKYQSAGDAQLRRLKGAIDYMKQAQASNNPQAVEAAWQQVRPYFAKVAGSEPPATFAEAEPHFGQLEARIAMATAAGAQGNVQSVKIGEDGYYYNVYRDGRIVSTGVKANPNIKVLEQEGTTPYGVVTSGGVAGSVVPLGGGGVPGATGQFDDGGGVTAGAGGAETRVNIDGVDPARQQRMAQTAALMRQAGYPAEEIDAFVAAQAGQPRDVSPAQFAAGGPVRTPTAGEKAAAEAAARRQVELSTLPAELQMRRESEVQQAGDVQRAKDQAEREANEPKRQEAVRQIVTKVDALSQDIDRAIAKVDWKTAGFLGNAMANVAGTPANDLRVTANTIKANLAFDALQQMRAASPTGGALGAVSERELALLESAVASIDQSQRPEQLRDALERVKQHYANWKQAVMQADQEARQRAGGQPAPATPSGASRVRVFNPATGRLE